MTALGVMTAARRWMTRVTLLAGLSLLATAAPADAQSKGYRPPPPPPPPPPRPAPTTSVPYRAPSPPPARSTPSSTSQSSSSTATSAGKSTPRASSDTAAKKGTSDGAATKSTAELQKTIGSDTKRIDTYRARVNNPQANYPGWNSLSRERQTALMNQWNAELRRSETSRATAQRALSQRTR